jgi:aspartyl/asparaginyl beta-hydroxylase (cupin superfamily)
VDNPDWGAFYLVKSGAEVPENAARCPRTMAALRAVPMCRIKGRTQRFSSRSYGRVHVFRRTMAL